MLKNLKLPNDFGGEVFICKIWCEGSRVFDFLLIGWWWSNRAVFQESSAQSEVANLHLDGDFSSCRRSQRYYVHSLGKNQDPALRLHYCFFTDLFFCIPFLPWLATVFICPQSKSKRLNKSYFLQTRNKGHRKYLYLRRSHRILLSFFLIFLTQMRDQLSTKLISQMIYLALICHLIFNILALIYLSYFADQILCHFLCNLDCACPFLNALEALCAYSLSHVHLFLCDPMDYSPPGSSVHGDAPGKNTGVGCISFSRGSSQGSNSGLSIVGGFFTICAIRNTQMYIFLII